MKHTMKIQGDNDEHIAQSYTYILSLNFFIVYLSLSIFID